MLKLISNNPEETSEIGKYIGELLKSGDIVCLIGDLGAGKTTLTKAIAVGLEIDDYVTSPTFTLVNEYDGKYHVNHFDVYRVSDVDEILDIGFEEYIYSDSVTIIEWANLIREILPKDVINIEIKRNLDTDCRDILIYGEGDSYNKIVEKLKEEFTNVY